MKAGGEGRTAERKDRKKMKRTKRGKENRVKREREEEGERMVKSSPRSYKAALFIISLPARMSS